MRLLRSAFLLLLLPSALWPSSGGPYDLLSDLPGAPGGNKSGTSVTGEGPVDLFATGALQAAAGAERFGGTWRLLGGYFSTRERAFLASLQVLPLLRPGPRVLLGADPSADVLAGFNVPMSATSLLAATTVYLLYDNLGNSLQSSLAYSLAYDPDTFQARIRLPGGWKRGYEYRVDLGTRAASVDGSFLPSSASVSFQVSLSSSQLNVVRAQEDPSIRLVLPPGALPFEGAVSLRLDPLNSPERVNPERVRQATSKSERNFGPLVTPLAMRELVAYRLDGSVYTGPLGTPVDLSFPFSDADGDGLLDGTPVRRKSLAVWELDEGEGLWLRRRDTRLDLSRGEATLPLTHFSVYALIPTADQDVSTVYAYPVPWRPFAGDPARYGELSKGITFAQLPQEGSIRIYTLSGQLVLEKALEGPNKWVWDARNLAGEEVASGVYLWEVRSGSNRRSGKLVIVK